MSLARQSLLRNSKIGLLLAILLCGSMWLYVRGVLVPYQRADAALHERPRGNLSDLYPRWFGARELLLHHRDPYSAEVTREIQIGYYGRPLDPSRLNDPKDRQGFVYPAYVAFLLAPTLWIPFPTLQIVFRWFLVALSAITVPLWLRAVGWRAPGTTVLAVTILTLGSFPAAQGIELQQLTLLVSALIAVSIALLSSGRLFLAGICLALATIKPQLLFPLAAWLCLWTFAGGRERRNFIYGFFLAMLILVFGSEVILPGWLGRFAHAMAAYREYTDAKSILEVLTNRFAGKVLTVLVIVSVGSMCWRMRREAYDSALFRCAFSMVLAATVVIVPTYAPYNQLLLLPAIFLLWANRRILFSRNLGNKIMWTVAGIAISWPWIAALGLCVARLVLPADWVQRAWALPLYTSIAIPLAISGLLFQYGLQISRLSPPDSPRPEADCNSRRFETTTL